MQFSLKPLPKPRFAHAGELACPFFLWTKAFTSEQRISFNYVDKAGMTMSNTPVLAEVTIHHRFKEQRSGRDDDIE